MTERKRLHTFTNVHTVKGVNTWRRAQVGSSHVHTPKGVCEHVNASARSEALDLAHRLRHLSPDHRDPERYHVEKSEIENGLRKLAKRLEADHG